MKISNLSNRIVRITLLFSLLIATTIPLVQPTEVAYGYGNILGITTIVDAPWRVEPDSTSIPILILVKDMADSDEYDLQRVEVRQKVDHWYGSFYDRLLESFPIAEELTDNLYNPGDWYTILSLGKEGVDEEGDTYSLSGDVELEVKLVVGGWAPDQHHYMRVNVASDPLPSLPGLYLGDTHSHSSYTDNMVESGAPVEATVLAGEAIGLDWNVITDHSFDLRDNREGTDVNHKWRSLKTDIANFSTDSYRLILGEEVSCYGYTLDDYCGLWATNPGVIHFLILGVVHDGGHHQQGHQDHNL